MKYYTEIMLGLILALALCIGGYYYVTKDYIETSVAESLLNRTEKVENVSDCEVKDIKQTKVMFKDDLPSNLPGQVNRKVIDSRYYVSSSFEEGQKYTLIKETNVSKQEHTVVHYKFVKKGK